MRYLEYEPTEWKDFRRDGKEGEIDETNAVRIKKTFPYDNGLYYLELVFPNGVKLWVEG